jgi:hypothetical protein
MREQCPPLLFRSTLTRSCCLLSRCGSRRVGSRRCRPAAFPATLSRGFLIHRFAASGATRLFAAAVHLVDRGPSSAFRFFLRHTAFLVAFFNVLGFPFLFLSIFRFIAAGHGFISPLPNTEAATCVPALLKVLPPKTIENKPAAGLRALVAARRRQLKPVQ